MMLANFTLGCGALIMAFLVTSSLVTLTAQPERGPLQSGTVMPGMSLEIGLHQIAVASGIPIGFESAKVLNEKVATKAVLKVEPAAVSIALSQVLGPDTKYDFIRVDNIIVVRPKDGRSGALDRQVNLEAKDEDLFVTGSRVRDVFRDPRLPPRPVSNMGSQSTSLLKKRVTASGNTVLAFLNDVISKHGQATWTWSYSNTSAIGERIQPDIRFRSFDQSMISYGIGAIN